tara:strand:- start:44 stop:691 length:648 start_codon:yes stop_codon:yes gene_type:complete
MEGLFFTSNIMPTQPWFATPVYVNDVHESEDSYNEIQEELLSSFNKQKFNQIAGWSPDTHELNEDPFRRNVIKECPKFLDFLHDNVMSYMDDIRCTLPREYVITSSWFTKTKHGKYAHLHDHGNCDMAGVYYLQTNGKDGNLIFHDINSSYAKNYIYRTITVADKGLPLEQGLLALWPGILQHTTEFNRTQDVRISLSFNISFLEKFDGDGYIFK